MANSRLLVLKSLERCIIKHITKNMYLFFTDDVYIVNCHLKPRLIAGAVEAGCSYCRKKHMLSNCGAICFQDLFLHGMFFATNFVNSKNNQSARDA